MNISDISSITWCLLGLSAIMAVVYCLWQWQRTRRVSRHARATLERAIEDPLPSVSVVMYANNDGDWLRKFLPSFLEQDYPAKYEVIVVNDGSVDNSRDIVADYMSTYAHLRHTFAPAESRGLSRKKLSLMIGIKAAKYDKILITNANSRPATKDWLALMMRNFANGVQVVIGYSLPHFKDDHGAGKYYRVWDNVREAMRYINAAIKGKPYRGTAYNLAFEKAEFFEKKGFAKAMFLNWGEDDAWLKVMIKRDNTRCESDPSARVIEYYDDHRRAHKELKIRRDFTSQFVRRKPFLTQALMTAVYYLWVALAIAAVVVSACHVAVITIATLIAFAAWIACIIIYNKQARTLRAPGLFLSVPLMILLTPLSNCFYKIIGRRHRPSNLTSSTM